MLYALNLDLTRLISNQPLDGTPYKIHYPPPMHTRPEATATPAASRTPPPAVTQALPLSATAGSLPRRSHGLLRGGFRGVLLYEQTALQAPHGKIEAVNRRGRRYPGELRSDGSFEFTRLPWGTYQLVFKIEGFHRKVVDDQLLAFTCSSPLEVELLALPSTAP
jgi:hypothetical protein